MERAIGVVNLEVCAGRTVGLNMNSIHRHSVRVSTENSWLVHVIPEAVNIAAAKEDVIGKKVAPEVLRVLVQEIDPS